MFCKEYRRIARADNLKKVHILKYSMLCGEVKRKLGSKDKIIQQDYFHTQSDVLMTILRRNLISDNNSNQSNIVTLLENYIEKFQKEPNHILFLSIIDFQETISLLFAFFLKLTNNYHKLFIEFCTFGLFSYHICLI